MNPLPPTPKALQYTPTLNTLRALMAKERVAKESTFNLAKDMLKPGTKIMYKRGGREGTAKVIDITGCPGRIAVHAERSNTLKKIELQLEDIIGIVQES